MKLKFIVASLMAAASFSAVAGDQNIAAIADGNAYNFSAVVGDGILSGGHDLITLNGLTAGVYNVGISIAGQKLSFDQAASNLNGQTGETFGAGNLKFFGVEFSGTGPFVLDLAGSALAGASYSGTYTVSAVSPVPEPATYGMLLGGLGLLGFMARRKAAKKAA